MPYRLAADALVSLHLLFILYVLFGGLLVWRWPRMAWLHLPAVAWGVLVETMHWLCPLTDWENHLRHAAGERGYADSFIEHYVWPVIYPAGLTAEVQWLLGVVVLGVNAGVYAGLLLSRRR